MIKHIAAKLLGHSLRPNMYQSAQCKGQFIYSRFRNVSDTFDMYANKTKSTYGIFDPTANFVNSEKTCSFKNNIKDLKYNKFWVERYNFYKPDGYTNDIKNLDKSVDETRNQEIYDIKKKTFDHIVKLYDNLTGSTVSSFLYFTEDDITLHMWKYKESFMLDESGENIIKDSNYISYAARNIITKNTFAKELFNKKDEISLEGIYYMDSNGEFNIYTEEKKNYTECFNCIIDENGNKILQWKWVDGNTNEKSSKMGVDSFILDDNIFDGYKTNNGAKTKNNIGVIKMEDAYTIIRKIEVILNRVPKTFKKPKSAIKSLYSDSKVIMRLNNLINNNNSLTNTNYLQQTLIKANKIAARSAYDVKAVNTATLNQIEPKIQSAYGFSDLGKIKNLNIDGFLSMDDGSFVTTHKIGYEDADRYRTGTSSCDSFLFLSPLNHSSIQVNGDSNKSNITIKSNESIRVPIVYQYRMEDYDGKIFGKLGNLSTDESVKNTKYANIIGIDIWLNTLSDTPKQYDIVVYSTYSKDISISSGTILK